VRIFDINILREYRSLAQNVASWRQNEDPTAISRGVDCDTLRHNII